MFNLKTWANQNKGTQGWTRISCRKSANDRCFRISRLREWPRSLLFLRNTKASVSPERRLLVRNGDIQVYWMSYNFLDKTSRKTVVSYGFERSINYDPFLQSWDWDSPTTLCRHRETLCDCFLLAMEIEFERHRRRVAGVYGSTISFSLVREPLNLKIP